MAICSWEDCENEVYVKKSGLCKKHYSFQYRTGTLEVDKRIPRPQRQERISPEVARIQSKRRKLLLQLKKVREGTAGDLIRV